MEVTAFLPCRKGSERVQNKNIRPFGDYKHGLVEVKLRQLVRVESLSCIIVSTNDEQVIEVAKNLKHDKIQIIFRRQSLCTSKTSTDDLIKYVPEIINSGYVLWTHTTSPFIKHDIYEHAINTFTKLPENYDSLMSVTELQEFIWDESGPVNYDRAVEKWPRTQTLKSLYAVNSGIFISHIDLYQKYSDRIGMHPYLYVIDKMNAWDIDWPSDFELAEKILQAGRVNV